MNGVIGGIIPLAVGIAISPIPIIATILILMSPRATGSSLAFLAGWTVGIVAAVTVFSLLGSAQPDGDTGSRPVTGTIQLMIGALLGLLAIRQWRSRPDPGEEPALPGWMSAIDTMGPGKAAGLAFALAAVNPKNLLMAGGAGVTISALATGDAVVAIAVFTIVAAATVAVPVVAFLVAGERLATPLDRLRVWLVHNNATIMAVLLVVLASNLIGKGIASF